MKKLFIIFCTIGIFSATIASEDNVSNIPTNVIPSTAESAGSINNYNHDYELWLIYYNSSKLKVIKAVYFITGCGLKEAKEIVDYCPNMIKTYTDLTEATRDKTILENAGATCEIRYILPDDI